VEGNNDSKLLTNKDTEPDITSSNITDAINQLNHLTNIETKLYMKYTDLQHVLYKLDVFHRYFRHQKLHYFNLTDGKFRTQQLEKQILS